MRPVPALVRDRERRLVLELSYHFVTCGIKLGLVLVVSGLLRRAGEAGAQDALVDEQIQVGVDVLFQVEAPRQELVRPLYGVFEAC